MLIGSNSIPAVCISDNIPRYDAKCNVMTITTVPWRSTTDYGDSHSRDFGWRIYNHARQGQWNPGTGRDSSTTLDNCLSERGDGYFSSNSYVGDNTLDTCEHCGTQLKNLCSSAKVCKILVSSGYTGSGDQWQALLGLGGTMRSGNRLAPSAGTHALKIHLVKKPCHGGYPTDQS